MAVAPRSIKVKIKAKDNVTPVLKRIRKNLKQIQRLLRENKKLASEKLVLSISAKSKGGD